MVKSGWYKVYLGGKKGITQVLQSKNEGRPIPSEREENGAILCKRGAQGIGQWG